MKRTTGLAIGILGLMVSGCSLLGGKIPCTADVNCPSDQQNCVDNVCQGDVAPGPAAEPGVTPEPGGTPEPSPSPEPGEDPPREPCDANNECAGTAYCLTDGFCHTDCVGDSDCDPRETCVNVGSIFDFDFACITGCRNDVGCGSGNLCDFDHNCVAGTPNTVAEYGTCLSNTHCANGNDCVQYPEGGRCLDECDPNAGDPCGLGFDCIAGYCGQLCDGCTAGESCCEIAEYSCTEDNSFSCGPPGF